jgi:protein-S-isoprenylcysteine O-methyltransferase Ste14
VAGFYSFYSSIPQFSAILTWHLNGWKEALNSGGALFINWLVQAIAFFEFDGKNYELFNTYCLHPLLLYVLSFNLFTIRYLINPDPFTDKYWHLFLKCAACFPTTQNFVCAESPAPDQADSSLAKTAILSLLVKAFFLPVFLSWTIGNVFHADYLLQNSSLNFFSINSFIVHLIISIDVLIFAVAYFVELPLFKNQIKSVDSTLMGWLLCIICYPPINTWIFQGLDAPLTSTWSGVEEGTSKFFLVLITLLWAIYAWATITLGFKASNLTNRGIVANGPYRYVRHPAYISKLLLWTISGLFLAQFNFLLIATFWVVYWGRAVTEERHLEKYSDYLEYQARVPWRFIPGIY